MLFNSISINSHTKKNAPRKITGWPFTNNRDFTVKPQHNVIKMSKIYNS